jgi:pSer/pThr/pTyr-binding forkhead associated (FHA) protein
MPKLVITDNEGSRTLALDREVKAGRLAENEIQLKVPEASRHHCRFFDEKGVWFVEDMGSSNGTLVNGRKVSKFELQDGDLISVGAVTMRFLDSAATPEEKGAAAGGGWGDDEISLETETFLVLGAPGREGEVVKVKGDRMTIGRKGKHDLVLSDASISQDHAEIKKAGGSWTIRDLGSSNGTFVDGERVTEATLPSGAVVTFGEIAATFGVGDSAEFGPPRAAAVARAETTILDTESAFADPTFALSEVPEKKSPLPSILAVLLLLGLAGGVAWLYMNRQKLQSDQGGTVTVNYANNLVPRHFWSFEPNDLPPTGEENGGWHKEDAVDTASAGEVPNPVHSGDQAWSISRQESDKATPATWAFLSGSTETEISVNSGSVYKLSGWIYNDSGKPIPGLAVAWIEPVSGEAAREVAREVVPAATPAKKWTQVSGFVQAPDGASRVRVGVVSGGVGDVVFDDIVLETAQPPAGRAAEVRGFRSWLTSGGATRVFHFARPVSDGMGIWKVTEAGLLPPWQAIVPKAANEGLGGTLRDGGADVAIRLIPAENAFSLRWDLSAAAPGHAIVIPLPAAVEDVNVTLLEGAAARRMRAAFSKAAADGVIVGGQGDRMRIRFLDGQEKPFSAQLDVVTDSGRPLLKLDLGDRKDVLFRCELSFDAEMASAREKITNAGQKAAAQKYGEAIALYDQVLAEFPFDEATEKQASAAQERLMNEGRARIRALSTRVDDAKFFRTARVDDELFAEIQVDMARLAGTKLEPELKIKLDELTAERTKSAAEKNDAAAHAAYLRAEDYATGKEDRRAIAIQLLEMVISRYPDTEWAEKAKQLLERLKSK